MMKCRGIATVLVLLSVVLGGCATMPTGPSVMVLPPQGKSFEQFQADDAICRQWAGQQIGLNPQQAANQNTVAGGVIGTAVGAGAGAAIGAAAGSVGAGAAIGAASGLLIGTAAGANAGQMTAWEAQRRYDNAYVQCMYAKGNMVPGAAAPTHRYRSYSPPPPPPDLNSAPQGYSPYSTPPPSPPPPPVQ
ncbi:MAG: glycine zipper family protein [Thermodesulfovibrionales bacterium]|jgi:hypothetical protein